MSAAIATLQRDKQRLEAYLTARGYPPDNRAPLASSVADGRRDVEDCNQAMRPRFETCAVDSQDAFAECMRKHEEPAACTRMGRCHALLERLPP